MNSWRAMGPALWSCLILGLAVPTGRGTLPALDAPSRSGDRLGTRPPSVLGTIRDMGNRPRIQPSLRTPVPRMDGAGSEPADRRRGVRRAAWFVFRRAQEAPAILPFFSALAPAAANRSTDAISRPQGSTGGATVPRPMPAAVGAMRAPVGKGAEDWEDIFPEPSYAALASEVADLDRQIQVRYSCCAGPVALFLPVALCVALILLPYSFCVPTSECPLTWPA
jgi:hypothetical protein